MGVKALALRDGRLWSPQQRTLWPAGEPLVAACGKSGRKFRWVLREAPAGWEGELFWVPSSILEKGKVTPVGWPKAAPPDGMVLVPEEVPHRLEGCTSKCGIYVVSTPKQCDPYMNSDELMVLVQVALWGEVVRGDKGARGQFAYPLRLVAPMEDGELVTQAAQEYGVPCDFA